MIYKFKLGELHVQQVPQTLFTPPAVLDPNVSFELPSRRSATVLSHTRPFGPAATFYKIDFQNNKKFLCSVCLKI